LNERSTHSPFRQERSQSRDRLFQPQQPPSGTFPAAEQLNQERTPSQPPSGVPMADKLSLHEESIQLVHLEEAPDSPPAKSKSVREELESPREASRMSAEKKSNLTPSPGKKSFLQNIIQSMSPGGNESAEAK